jgi:hypothetical protein
LRRWRPGELYRTCLLQTRFDTMLETAEASSASSASSPSLVRKEAYLEIACLGEHRVRTERCQALARITSRSLQETLALLDEVLRPWLPKLPKSRRSGTHCTRWRTGYTYQRQIAVLEEQARRAVCRVRPGCGGVAHGEGRARAQIGLAVIASGQNCTRKSTRLRYGLYSKTFARILNLPEGTVCSRLATREGVWPSSPWRGHK